MVLIAFDVNKLSNVFYSSEKSVALRGFKRNSIDTTMR